MTGGDLIDVARDAIYTLIVVAGPIMAVGLSVGIAVALFQSLTQLQEMTLTFVPKILAIFVSLLLFLPFMGASLAGLMERLADRIVTGG